MRELKGIIIIISAGMIILTGCTSMSNDIKVIPTQGLKLVPIDYTVIGDTTAEESRVSVFGVDWEHLFYDEAARNITDIAIPSPFFITLDYKAKQGALYKALQKVPQADRIIEPRWTVKTHNFLLFQKVTVTVTAKAISYTKSSPMSN